METGATLRLQYKVYTNGTNTPSAQHQSAQSQTSVTNQKVIASITSQCRPSITSSQPFPHCIVISQLLTNIKSTTSPQHTISYQGHLATATSAVEEGNMNNSNHLSTTQSIRASPQNSD